MDRISITLYNEGMEQGMSYDDVLLKPGYSDISPDEIDTSVTLAKGLTLNIPIFSAAMDTITDARMATALALLGGVGVIHRNFPVSEQVRQIAQVKESLSWLIHNPITIIPDATVRDAYKIMEERNVDGLPVVQGKKLVGIVTKKDLVLAHGFDVCMHEIMTNDPICYRGDSPSFSEIMDLFKKHRVGRILLIDTDHNLTGMVTLDDFYDKQFTTHENAALDTEKKLIVGAAVSPHGLEERAYAVIDAGANFLVLDSAHGDSYNVIDSVKYLKQHFPDVIVVAGNVAVEDATTRLCEVGADIVKVGMGPGSICTTRVVSGMGMPQFSAVYQCAEVAKKFGKTIIADGGVRYSGDIAKAIGAGAASVMVGNMLAGIEETPGKQFLHGGKITKLYRGMGSTSAITEGSGDRYQFSLGESIVPEGVESYVAYKGSLKRYLYQIITGLKKGMAYCGCKTINDLMVYRNFVRITHAGVTESHPHDVHVIERYSNF